MKTIVFLSLLYVADIPVTWQDFTDQWAQTLNAFIYDDTLKLNASCSPDNNDCVFHAENDFGHFKATMITGFHKDTVITRRACIQMHGSGIIWCTDYYLGPHDTVTSINTWHEEGSDDEHPATIHPDAVR